MRRRTEECSGGKPRWRRKATAALLGIVACLLLLGFAEAITRSLPSRPAQLLRVERDGVQADIVFNPTTRQRVPPEAQITIHAIRIPLECPPDAAPIRNVFLLGGSNIAGAVEGPHGSPAPMLQYLLSHPVRRLPSAPRPVVHKLGLWGQGFSAFERLVREVKSLGGTGIWVFADANNQGLPQEVGPLLLEEMWINRATRWLHENSHACRAALPPYLLIPGPLRDENYLWSTAWEHKRLLTGALVRRLDRIVQDVRGDPMILTTTLPNERVLPLRDTDIRARVRDPARWDALTQQGMESLVDGQPDAAIRAFLAMRDMAADSPFLSFLLGVAYERQWAAGGRSEDRESSRAFYARAMRQDRMLVRVFPEINETLRDWARDRGDVSFVDVEALGRTETAAGIYGQAEFKDWCHTTMDASYRLISTPLSQAILRVGYPGAATEPPMPFSSYREAHPFFQHRSEILQAASWLYETRDTDTARERLGRARATMEPTVLFGDLVDAVLLLDEGKDDLASARVEGLTRRYGCERAVQIIKHIPIEVKTDPRHAGLLAAIEALGDGRPAAAGGLLRPWKNQVGCVQAAAALQPILEEARRVDPLADYVEAIVDIEEGRLLHARDRLRALAAVDRYPQAIATVIREEHSILGALAARYRDPTARLEDLVNPSRQRREFRLGVTGRRLPSLRKAGEGTCLLQVAGDTQDLDVSVDGLPREAWNTPSPWAAGHHIVCVVNRQAGTFVLECVFVEPGSAVPTTLELPAERFRKVPAGLRAERGVLKDRANSPVWLVRHGEQDALIGENPVPIPEPFSYERAVKAAEALGGRLPSTGEWLTIAGRHAEGSRESPTEVHALIHRLDLFLAGGMDRLRRARFLDDTGPGRKEFVSPDHHQPAGGIIVIQADGAASAESVSDGRTPCDGSAFHVAYDVE